MIYFKRVAAPYRVKTFHIGNMYIVHFLKGGKNLLKKLTLRLHYVPGDHGSHGSPKRSAPCDLVNFCL